MQTILIATFMIYFLTLFEKPVKHEQRQRGIWILLQCFGISVIGWILVEGMPMAIHWISNLFKN